MFVRRLVTGVRSSCEASATSWRCARTDSSSSAREPCEPLEHVVEARRQLPDLVVGVDPQAMREVVGLADLLGGLRDLGERRDHAPRREPAEHGRQRDPPSAHSSSSTRRRFERMWSTPLSGRASWTATAHCPLGVNAGAWNVNIAQVAAADADVLEIRCRRRRGDARSRARRRAAARRPGARSCRRPSTNCAYGAGPPALAGIAGSRLVDRARGPPCCTTAACALQLAVDLAPQLIADDEVADARREHDRHADRDRATRAQVSGAAASAQSRST